MRCDRRIAVPEGTRGKKNRAAWRKLDGQPQIVQDKMTAMSWIEVAEGRDSARYAGRIAEIPVVETDGARPKVHGARRIHAVEERPTELAVRV